jgi:hypothetical protein
VAVTKKMADTRQACPYSKLESSVSEVPHCKNRSEDSEASNCEPSLFALLDAYRACTCMLVLIFVSSTTKSGTQQVRNDSAPSPVHITEEQMGLSWSTMSLNRFGSSNVKCVHDIAAFFHLCVLLHVLVSKRLAWVNRIMLSLAYFILCLLLCITGICGGIRCHLPIC